MQLPQGVTIIATVLDHNGPIIDCTPQTIETALLRMWSRTLWAEKRGITCTTFNEKGSPTRCSDLDGTWISTTRADAASAHLEWNSTPGGVVVASPV